MKSILNSDRQNAILMYTQILIDIPYDPMQISCQQCCHVDWDCDSLAETATFDVKNAAKNSG